MSLMNRRRWQVRVRTLLLGIAAAALVLGLAAHVRRRMVPPGRPVVPLSAAIERAIPVAFAPADRQAVRAGLLGVSWGGETDWVRAATLALTFGDRALFDDWIVTARADLHDVAYVLESPELVREGLTPPELVRRYRAMGLPVPGVLGTIP